MAEAGCLAGFAGGDDQVSDGDILNASHLMVSFNGHLAMAQWPHHRVH